MSDLATLNPAAQIALVSCEQRIERGLKTFIDVGQALAEIRDSRLYRGTHETFEAYLEQRWQMSRSYAHRMIAAAEIALPIGNTELPAVRTESQARELAKVPEPERAEVWRETVERTEGKPTAAAIRETVERNQTPGSGGAVNAPPPDPGIDESPAPAEPEPDTAEHHANLDAQLDAAMEGTPQRFRRNFSAAVARSDDVWQFDPERIAEVYAGDFSQAVRPFLEEMTRWCEAVAAAHRRKSGLRVVGGNR